VGTERSRKKLRKTKREEKAVPDGQCSNCERVKLSCSLGVKYLDS